MNNKDMSDNYQEELIKNIPQSDMEYFTQQQIKKSKYS